MKKLLVWGAYDAFAIGNTIIYKHQDNCTILTLKTGKSNNIHRSFEILSTRFIESTDFKKMILKEKPDFFCVIAGNVLVETIQEFNKTNFVCQENAATLALLDTQRHENLVLVYPHNIFAAVTKLIQEGT